MVYSLATQPSIESCRLYIVDDDERVRKTLTKVFITAGIDVYPCASGQEFLDSFHIAPNTGVLLDLRMPGMSGLELLKIIHSRGLVVPVIIYTAFADVEATVQAFSDGAYTVIQKPTSSNLLIDKVKEAIAKSAADNSLRNQKLNAIRQLERLSKREYEIAIYLAEGKSAPEIAKLIDISSRTVETHRVNIYSNLEIKSAAELARIVTLAVLEI